MYYGILLWNTFIISDHVKRIVLSKMLGPSRCAVHPMSNAVARDHRKNFYR